MKISNNAEWQKYRMQGIGGSEAAAVVGRSPYMSNVDLWKIKTGKKRPNDISGRACVIYGHAAEAPLRELFALDYPDYKVEYLGAYDVVQNPKYPFIKATLDGRILERDTGRWGVYEGKTAEMTGAASRLKWMEGIPDNYYIQLLHQLLATGWDFAVLNAQLRKSWDGEITTEVRRYFVEKDEARTDMEYLLENEIRFWECVQSGKKPPLILPDIF